MGVAQVRIQTVEDMYRLVGTAVMGRRPITVTYHSRIAASVLTGCAVVLQRRVPVGVPRGVGQTLNICREAPQLWAWRREA